MSQPPVNRSKKYDRNRLAAWLHKTLSHPGTRMRCRVRGNILHLLYEGEPCPQKQTMVYQVLKGLNKKDINTLAARSTQIYQVWLYGRSRHQQKPAWTFRIDLDQLGHYLHHFTVCPIATSITTAQSSNALNTVGSQQRDHADIDPSRVRDHAEPTLPSLSDQIREGTSPPITSTVIATNDTVTIARCLSETLSRLGVAVAVRAKTLSRSSKPAVLSPSSVSFPSVQQSETQRLLISCQATYSPSASLIADPIARQLRSLNLTGFQDAIVSVQVNGEEDPDWTLRIDLTPSDTLLREWAQWGDVAALSHLIDQALSPIHATVINASQEEKTLHLVCQSRSIATSDAIEQTPTLKPDNDSFSKHGAKSNGSVPNRIDEHGLLNGSIDDSHDDTSTSHQPDHPLPNSPDQVAHVNPPTLKDIVHSLLNELSPQGIQGAVLCGHQNNQDTPSWVEYLTLDTHTEPDRLVAPLVLAHCGHLEAIAYLVSRLLNPDLDTQLATGGIRVQLLKKDALLHIMCDAPMCPNQDDVTSKIIRLLEQIQQTDVIGVRIYGRQAGLRTPHWSFGTDFDARPQLVPQPPPEFAASHIYVNDLLNSPDESPLREELTAAELFARWARFRGKVMHQVQRSLLRTQLIALTSDSPALALPASIHTHGLKTAAVWAAVGLLSVIQVDWVLGHTARTTAERIEAQEQVIPPVTADQNADFEGIDPLDSAPEPTGDNGAAPVPQESLPQESPSVASEIFSPEMAATGSSLISIVPGSSSDILSAMQSELLNQSPYPTFNSTQLDLKLALYYQHIAESGPPDVLIIGSSRALRGIDPVVLEKALTDLGYDNADVFNFGINGATAQVVELVIHRILVPEQLPKLILWADGARAFNGGREDRTYSGITESEGYQLLSQGNLDIPVVTGSKQATQDILAQDRSAWINRFRTSLTDSYDELDTWLSDQLAVISIAHDNRDILKALIQDGLTGNFSGRLQLAFGNEASPSQSEAQASPPSQPTAVDTGDVTEPDRVLGKIGGDGFLPLDARFDPVTYYEQYSRVPGNHDKDYANFQLTGQQADSLQTLLQLGNTHDVPIVFINLPLTDEYLDPYRMVYEQEFRQHLLSIDLEHDEFIFRDLSEMWLTDNEQNYYQYFSDPSHLNRYGAFEVSKRIAQDPMIPWIGSEF